MVNIMNGTDSIATELAQMQQKMLLFLQKHWQLFFVEGVIFVLLGVSAIVIPQFYTEAIILFLGWIIGIGGAVHVSRALLFRDMPGFGLWIFWGFLQILVGILLIADPNFGVITITIMMTLFFAAEGGIKIYWAFMLRPLQDWKLILISGVTELVFALIILMTWSKTVHWLLGLFLGINMIMLGCSIVKVSLSHKVSG
jgi:uncharacterized membrane protein HdeD (DUF308 family)